MGSIAIAFYVQSHAMLVLVLFNAVSFGANKSFRDSITQELTSLFLSVIALVLQLPVSPPRSDIEFLINTKKTCKVLCAPET